MNTIGQALKVRKEKKREIAVFRHKKTGQKGVSLILRKLLVFFLCFFLSRAQIFLGITPLSVSSFLALGGGVFPFLGGVLGSITAGSAENVFSLTCAMLLKNIFREEKWDALYLFIAHTVIWSVALWLREPTPFDLIVKVVTLLIALLGYFVLKKAYLAQFVKSAQLKFTRQEAYCSLFLLFGLIAGVRSDVLITVLNFHDVLKFFIISMAAYYFGIGAGSATGAILGMLCGSGVEYAALCMSVYSLFGFFAGIFSKFSKFTALLGLIFSYVFSVMYFAGAQNVVLFRDVAVAGGLFFFFPEKWIRPYIERYTCSEPTDMVRTVNTITANRLDKLAKSFSGLSGELSRTQKNIHSVTQVNENTLFDFVGERLCKRCSLKNVCWQEQYSDTAEILTKAVGHLSRYGQLEERNLPQRFLRHCVHPGKVVGLCKNFYELYRLNAVWKHKLSENTEAFQQQFIELSSIICELKQNIVANRYFDARLSSEIYSALGNAGYLVKEASVLKTASEHFLVQLELAACRYNENCFSTLEKLIGDILGVKMIRVEGGCGDHTCRFTFSEGEAGKLEKRVQSISKRDNDPVGDSHIISEISRNQYLMALSDGMGSGKEASRVSTSVVTLLDEMLKAGFSGESAYRMLNSFLIASCPDMGHSTLDFMVIDFKKMTGKIMKTGACPTYIKRGIEVIEIASNSLPAGIRSQKPFVKTVHLHPGDIIVMLSDGVWDALPEEDWVYGVLKRNVTADLAETVDLIASLAQKDFEKREDDITVLGVKLLKGD
ncbi:MAG: SpoIIE family protein phosphatase [Clostridia bacterium]|nr:SpoIIE family protein phosphatase [Clostridia bacterium]